MFTSQITETDLGQVQQVQRPENHVSLTTYPNVRDRSEHESIKSVTYTSKTVTASGASACFLSSLNDIHEVICQRKCPFNAICASVLKISNREYDCIVKN